MSPRSSNEPTLRRPQTALHAATFVAFLAASGVPTPLYRLYQDAWGFSPFMLTVAFAVYALALLSALLVLGSLSDRLGRRPVILAALAIEIVAILLLLGAQGIGWLIAGRLVQGFATGIATAALGAALLDTARERGALINSVAPLAGIGFGALAATLLAHFAPAPLHLVYALVLTALVVQTARTARAPDTITARTQERLSLRPRIAVPAQARATLAAVTPINVALWALGGFYLSLMPSLVALTAGPATAWTGGLAVAALTISGGAAVLVVRNRSADTCLIGGALALIVGPVGMLAGVHSASSALLLAGSVAGGVGMGAAFLGAVRRVMPLAAPHQRAGLMAAFYVESYTAFALPALAAGYAARTYGLVATADALGAGVGLVAAAALVAFLLRGRAGTRPSALACDR